MKLDKQLYYFWREVSCFIRRQYYKLLGIEVSPSKGSMLPYLGKGKYVSVYRKGCMIVVFDEKTKETFRIIPYQPNHGVMIEHVDREGHVNARQPLSTNNMKEYLSLFEEQA
jgi:hypothetical protein